LSSTGMPMSKFSKQKRWHKLGLGH
jgi:hypothetical protein